MYEFRSDLKQEAINTVKEKVQPALVELQQFIAEVRYILVASSPERSDLSDLCSVRPYPVCDAQMCSCGQLQKIFNF